MRKVTYLNEGFWVVITFWMGFLYGYTRLFLGGAIIALVFILFMFIIHRSKDKRWILYNVPDKEVRRLENETNKKE